MKRIGKIAVLAVTTLTAASCSLLDVEPTVIMKDTYYNTEQEVLHGLAGVYGAMNNEDFYGSNYSIICSLNDDLSYCRASSATYQIDFLEHSAGSIEVYNLWTAIYKGVKNANAFMNAMRDSDLDPDGFYYHEGRFMRAYYHFLLAQCWGDVPLLDFENTSAQKLHIAKTPQYDVLKWVIDEMDACLDYLPETLDNAPSRVTRTTAEGILARVCLFTAGATVDRGADSADDYYKKAMDYSWAVIDSGLHDLNPDYSDVFIRMISDKYDTQYRESMWEVEFKGNREDANNWTNGRIGELNGLQSSPSGNYDQCKCNYSYARYNGSLYLWDLYWQTDRTDDEQAQKTISDVRQNWNMPPYNYAGSTVVGPYDDPDGGKTTCTAGIDKTPYVYSGVATSADPTVGGGMRNCGKFRRETVYEGVRSSPSLYNQINFPILRYSDVLLMYAEAYNEYNKTPSEDVYGYVVKVRNRAKIKTRPYSEYTSYAAFREFVRNERARELCFEAIRKYDLIRWGIFVGQLKKYAEWSQDIRWAVTGNTAAQAARLATVRERHIVLPVPSIEIGVNPSLKQHPLW